MMSMSILKNGSVVATMLSQHSTSGINQVSWEGDKILLIGSVFANRGDQAMTFTAVDQLSQRFPKKEIMLLTTHPEQILNPSKYKFEVFSLDPGLRAQSLNSIGRISGLMTPDSFDIFDQIWKDAAFAVDINGYVLSSQTGIDDTLSYILTLMVANKYGVPYYILPQSIGPFDFNWFEHTLVDPMLRKYIEMPQLIFPREEHGVEAMKAYTDRHTEQSPDIVLQHPEYDIDNIFINPPDIEVPQINERTVGIIPNGRVFQRVDKEEMLNIYSRIGEKLKALGYEITVLAHTTGDSRWCEEVHDAIGFGEILENAYNAIELEQIIEQFEFIIGSRYHSVIHAYKHAVPAVVIGWAVKYEELLQRFEQSTYHFDCRTRFDESIIYDSIEQLSARLNQEKAVIRSIRDEIQQTPVFDKLESDITSNT